MSSFLTVGTQVFILFIIMGLGFLARKLKWLNQEGVNSITNLMLYIITPCMLINAFQRPFSPDQLRAFLISGLAAAGSITVSIFLAKLFVRDKDRARQNVQRYAAIFSNCGYMSLPLQQALLGDLAVFYGASYVAIFNIFMWTYGLSLMCGGREKISLRRALLNPGTISVVIGLILFFGSVTLPELIARPVQYLAAVNTPMPMLLIGYYLAGMQVKNTLSGAGTYVALALKLIVFPLLTLGALWLCGVRGTLLISLVISVSAPVATISTMFATRYGGDAELSSALVAVSTLLSIFTMTGVVGLAALLA